MRWGSFAQRVVLNLRWRLRVTTRDNCAILKITARRQQNPGVQMSSVERPWKEGARKASQGARGATGLHFTYVIYTLDTEMHTPAAAESLCLLCFIIQVQFFISSVWRRPAAAAAKSLQLCLTLCDPIDGSPPGSPVPGILQARTLEWVAISFSNA